MSIVDERWAAAADLTALDRDTERALRAAARMLTRELNGTYDTQTIEHLLASRYAELANQARITKFLPLLAERFVRDRLRVLATSASAGGHG